MKTKAVASARIFGLKITNSKTHEVAFQCKFKVNKKAAFPGEAQCKNRFEFFVDNDWNLPISYVGFSYSSFNRDDLVAFSLDGSYGGLRYNQARPK